MKRTALHLLNLFHLLTMDGSSSVDCSAMTPPCPEGVRLSVVTPDGMDML